MKRTLTLAALAAASATTAGAAYANDGPLAIGASIGTTGATIEAQYEVTPYIHLRGNYNWLEYGADDTYDDIDYSGNLDMTTFGAFIDLHPFGNSFVVTGGAYFGHKALDLTAASGQTYDIGGNTYSSAQVGTLAGSAKLEDTAPFVGLGWDTTFQGEGAFGFKLIAGAMFTGSPQVNLKSTGGSLSSDTAFQNQLAIEEQNLQDEVDDYEIYPVVQAGLTFRF